MLLKLTGSSCSGKTTLAAGAVPYLGDGLVARDFDEIGVPSHPPIGWRNRATEAWIQKAIEYEREGLDLLLSGQSPLGEVLAAPSAAALDGIAVCLIDVNDAERIERLRQRDGPKWASDQERALVNWAAWHRGHASNPRHHPEVITGRTGGDMRWERWTGWSPGDRRWLTSVIDTSGQPVESSIAEVVAWVQRSRAALASDLLPLQAGWVDRSDQTERAEPLEDM